MYRLSELPAHLKEIRQEQHRRQEDIAEKMGISRELLSRYENEKLDMRAGRMDQLAQELRVRIWVTLEPITEAEENIDA